MALDSVIRKHVLKNIHDYGKASASSIVGKVIAEHPGCKDDMRGTMAKIQAEIGRVSALSKGQIEEEMSAFEYLVKEEKEKTITLPNAEQGKVITRFPPEPSGYPHIGHAKAAWLDYEAARAYDGYMILRFDDTNPEKESEEFVDAIKQGLEWLGIRWEKESFTSDQMDLIYEAARTLIKRDKAYVCTASQEDISKSRTEGKPLHDRGLPAEEHMKRWQDMLDGKYKPGEALLLFKGDLKADNTALRDPALARMLEKPHFRQKDKYRVWPGYDLAVVVMDNIEGITHSMRSKEYELRDELSLEMYKALGWEPPELVGFSRLAIRDAPVSKRLIMPLVEEKKVMGWDDPRLPTLAGLKRRGVLPEAIKMFVLSFGLSKVESEPDWEALLTTNRKLLDPDAPHYFFVPEPVLLEVEGLEDQEISLKLHPKKDLGERLVLVSRKVHIPKSDADKLKKGETFRLKDLCNVELTGKGGVLKGKLASQDKPAQKKIQWVCDFIGCEVLVPKDLLKNGEYDEGSLESVKGYCERSCAELKEDAIVQFERFGFCRLDRKEPLTFIFSC